MSTQGIKLSAIADAIRGKDATTAAIPAITFSDRILVLPVGVQSPSVTLPTASTQEEQLARIAAAIRAKEGSSDLIPANEFASRIAALEAQKPSRLPSGYTEVEYIHLSGSCGFNTKYFAKPATTRILMDVELEAYSESEGGYFFGEYGRYSQTTNTSYYYLLRRSETQFRLMTGQAAGGYTSLDVGSVSGNKITIDVNGPKKTVSIGNFSSSILNGPHNDNGKYLFVGGYFTGSASFPGKLYSCKVYVSGTLKFDFVPCKDSSGVSGLFDLVGNKFLSNSFDGIVTAGPAV